MYLGRVIGCVWCTVKAPALQGIRMLVVQPLTPELQNTGRRIVCTDSTGAGAGEIVYWVRGKEASFPFLPAEPPTDTTIVGIVDSVHLGPRAAEVAQLASQRAEAAVQPERGTRSPSRPGETGAAAVPGGRKRARKS
jgi:ethanolamine utilization protein EutN